MKADPIQKLRCHGNCCPLIEKHSVVLDLLAYENILRNSEIAQKVKLLVYHGDSKGSCVQHRCDFGLTTIKKDFASIRLVNACQYLHESGLPRTVLTEQGMNLSLTYLQRAIPKRLHSGKSFAYPSHFYHGFTHIDAS